MNAKEYLVRGFTLIELLLVLAALSIILSIGSLSFTNYLQRLRLNEAATEVAETLQRMSNDAARHNLKVTLDESVLRGNRLRWLAGSDVLGEEILPKGTTLYLVDRPSVASLDFSSRGLPYRQLTFEVKRSGLSQRVVLLPTGMVIH